MKWIKCSDRLPKEGERVIVLEGLYFSDGSLGSYDAYIAYWCYDTDSDSKDWIIECKCHGYEIEEGSLEPDYWMELPKEPKDN